MCRVGGGRDDDKFGGVMNEEMCVPGVCFFCKRSLIRVLNDLGDAPRAHWYIEFSTPQVCIRGPRRSGLFKCIPIQNYLHQNVPRSKNKPRSKLTTVRAIRFSSTIWQTFVEIHVIDLLLKRCISNRFFAMFWGPWICCCLFSRCRVST